ncbi:hypothetical protein [Nocardia nepalensis]|uniref:hypothetical protein n=1 Tax=Nocardia nepalensis TaxID=3375448 RepID=UPI003B67F010
MDDGSYWKSEAGLRQKDLRRFVSALRLGIIKEPRSKSAKGKAASRELRELLLEGAATWHRLDGDYGARWPRPRADLALDIAFRTTNPNSPRIDKLCKYLLDELGGMKGPPIVYNDDRQVKMLFAHRHTADDQPLISVTAQTVAQVRAGICRMHDFGTRWGVEYANWELDRHGDLDIDDDYEPGWWSAITTDPDTIAEFTLRDEVRQRMRYQMTNLAATDQFSSQVVLAYAVEQRRDRWAWQTTGDALHTLLDYGLAVGLGPLPQAAGQSANFVESTTSALADLVARRRWMTPLLPSVGLTLFYLETDTGKDLDNLFLDVLPIVLNVLRPPAVALAEFSPIDALRAWRDADQQGVLTAATEIAFIEAVALKGVTSDRLRPGSVILALSHGSRWESWWDSTLRFVEEHNDSTSPDDEFF